MENMHVCRRDSSKSIPLSGALCNQTSIRQIPYYKIRLKLGLKLCKGDFYADI